MCWNNLSLIYFCSITTETYEAPPNFAVKSICSPTKVILFGCECNWFSYALLLEPSMVLEQIKIILEIHII